MELIEWRNLSTILRDSCKKYTVSKVRDMVGYLEYYENKIIGAYLRMEFEEGYLNDLAKDISNLESYLAKENYSEDDTFIIELKRQRDQLKKILKVGMCVEDNTFEM